MALPSIHCSARMGTPAVCSQGSNPFTSLPGNPWLSGRWLAGHLSPLGWTKPILAPVAFPSSPDRPGVVQRLVVDQLQERFAMTLKAYIEFNRPQPAHR